MQTVWMTLWLVSVCTEGIIKDERDGEMCQTFTEESWDEAKENNDTLGEQASYYYPHPRIICIRLQHCRF